MSVFFISCQIGLENDLQNELENFWHQLIDLDGLPTRSRPEVVFEDQGGFEIECETHLGFQINLFSKLANRVLWRVHKFEARYFDQFEKELKKFDTAKYFGTQKFNLNIESSKSRLFHETNLLESAYKILKNASKETDDSLMSLYVRIHKDNVVISVDTSGHHLHKRGYRITQGAAPIRETLAAKMYNFLLQQSLNGQIKYNPKDAQTTLLDPFCGSGTLLFEAASFQLPNLVTTFDFEKMNSVPALFKSNSWKKNFKIERTCFNQFVGCELDLKTYEKLKINFEEFKKYFLDLDEQFNFKNVNSAEYDFAELDHKSVVFLANPPYGERLLARNAIEVLTSLERIQGLQGGVVVHPADWSFSFKKLKLKQCVPFNNQGLTLKLSLFAL